MLIASKNDKICKCSRKSILKQEKVNHAYNYACYPLAEVYKRLENKNQSSLFDGCVFLQITQNNNWYRSIEPISGIGEEEAITREIDQNWNRPIERDCK